MSRFFVSELSAGGGVLGLCPAPGRWGHYEKDLEQVLAWRPAAVVTMTEVVELERIDAVTLPEDLAQSGIAWYHLPIRDFGAPGQGVVRKWPDVSLDLRDRLRLGQRVLVHCFGGCGRSGMVLLRIMIELGEAPETALKRLRAERPCAVETDAQLLWAFAGGAEK